MKVFHYFFLVVSALLMVVPVSAQDTTQMGSADLAAMLRFMPDHEGARQSISFGDYRAAAAARPLEIVPQDFADFDSMEREARGLWVMSMPVGGVRLDGLFSFNDMPAVMGIDFFQISRSLTWGVPPDTGIVLQGDFDEAAIREALVEGRGFVESELDGAPLWCGPDGCDTGINVNVSDRQPSDLFGGDLGRKFPRVLSGDFLVSAVLDTSLEQMTDAGINGDDSLADDPMYQAAVAALDGDHYLRAVQFASPLDFAEFDYARIAPGASEERIREIIEQLRGSVEYLPAYDLVVIADISGAEREYGVIGLVYRDEEQATAAGEILIDRINAAVSVQFDRPWAEIIADQGATLEAPEVFYAEAADRYVTLIAISKPLTPLERQNEMYVQTGLLYRLFFDGYNRRDLGWLQPETLN